MIRLINTGKIEQSSQLDDIKRTFETLCSKREKGYLKRAKKAAIRNDFLFKSQYAIEWRIEFIKLICGLSILNKPNSPPTSHVGINNPKNMCFAITYIHCFLRCTRVMQKIVETENKKRNAFSKLLFNSLVEIKSAVYVKALSEKEDEDNNEEDEEKKDYIYAEFPEDYNAKVNTNEEKAEDIKAMQEFRDGEPHGKCR